MTPENLQKRIIMLGPQGSGKGTQAKLLAMSQGLRHIASGDILRSQAAASTPIGIQAKEYMDKGLLVPDEIVIGVVLDTVMAPESEKGFFLDGFPRNLHQAEYIDRSLTEVQLDIEVALLLNVPREQLFRRLTGRRVCGRCQSPYNMVSHLPRVTNQCDNCDGQLYQREDDTSESVETRFRVYHLETEPLIDYYTEHGTLKQVDGVGSVEIIHHKILAAFETQPVNQTFADR